MSIRRPLGQQGYILLISVLVIGAVSLAIALALLASGVDSQRATDIYQRSQQARALADGCAEEALQRLHDNTAYTGSDSLTLGTGMCSFSVVPDVPGSAIISASGVVKGVTRKERINVQITAAGLTIAGWQTVGSL